MKKKVMIGFVLIMVFSILYFCLNKRLHHNKQVFARLNYTNQNEATIESIIEYGEHSVIAAHYPVFGHKNIDIITKNLVLKYINDFKNSFEDLSVLDSTYKSELNIDYEVYAVPNGIVSIKFTILENMYYYAHPNSVVETLVFDLNNNSRLYLNNIFRGKYLEEICSLVIAYFEEIEGYKDYTNSVDFYEGIKPILANYSNFILEEGKITFIFNKYQLFPGTFGSPAIEIPFVLIEDYIKPNILNINSLETFSPLEIIENEKIIDIKTEENEEIEEIEPSRVIDPKKPMVALTFDDGPYIRATAPILNTLKKNNSVATFFVLGNRVPNNKNLLKRMVEEGSEIGNHSYNHKQLTTLSAKELKLQIDRTQKLILEVVGSEPKVMRPTYGSYDNRLREAIHLPMILWSIDPMDWKSQDSQKIKDHVLSRVKDGDIILMHDIFISTSDAVEFIIPELIKRGYQLVTVSELYESKGKVLEVGKIHYGLKQR